MTDEAAIGPTTARTSPAAEEILAHEVHVPQAPVPTERIMPKRPRLVTHIHWEPPSVPVYSYHWTLCVLRANALPSTIQGQDMSTEKYFLSQAIHITARKIYGTAPPR